MAKSPGKNIVLCFDGTGDWVGVDNTNVSKLFAQLDRENQSCFYDGGVGTLSVSAGIGKNGRAVLTSLDLATALNLPDKVLRGYMFLVEHYLEATDDREADRVYLFGFSRGAYTARLVASLIHNFGILRADCQHLAPYLWQTMVQVSLSREAQKTTTDAVPVTEGAHGPLADKTAVKPKRPRVLSSIGKFKRTANILRKRFSRGGAEVAFMGLFDTVSSVGIIGRFATFPNTDKNDSVARVCHAVSIDEQRNVFPESLMHPEQRGLTEVWFPGVHRDIGGGLPYEDSRISDETLLWIAIEAQLSGLLLDNGAQAAEVYAVPEDGNVTAEPVVPALTKGGAKPELRQTVVHYPKVDPYVPAGLYPMLMFNAQVSRYRYLWPNLRHSRAIPKGALVHKLACDMVQEANSSYAPPNLPPSDMRICFSTGDNTPGPTRNDTSWNKPGFLGTMADFFGVLIGSGLLAVLANMLLGRPYDPTWPVLEIWTPNVALPFAWLTGIVIFLFLVAEACGIEWMRRISRGDTKYFDGLAGFVAFVVALLFYLLLPTWNLFLAGAGLGLLFFVVAQFPPLPSMRADRVLPYILLSVLRSGLVFWIATAVAAWTPQFVKNLGSSLLTFAVGQRRVEDLVDFTRGIMPLGQCVGLAWLSVSLIVKLVDIVRDREAMRLVNLANNPPPASNQQVLSPGADSGR